tara:strand:- start:234 stop:614 length:381 start_codon:yes stop_codon:yes gene_type:complete
MKNSFNIKISVETTYLPEKSNLQIPIYFFAYFIEIINNSEVAIQLLNRHWEINDANGNTKIVSGPGVIGRQPIIKSNKSFKYNSFCPLKTEFGFMQGFYEMITLPKKIKFKKNIDPFKLCYPNSIN